MLDVKAGAISVVRAEPFAAPIRSRTWPVWTSDHPLGEKETIRP